MALTLRGTPVTVALGTATQDVTFASPPTGTTLGDLMFAHIDVRTGTVTGAPAGWTLIASQPTAAESYYVYWKFGATNEAGPYVWTTSATVRQAATIISYQAGTGDWDTVNPIQTFSNTAYLTADTNVIAATVSPTNTNSNVLVFAGVYDATQTQTMTPPTAPATFTQIVRVGTLTERCQIQVSKAVVAASGATGNITTTLSVAITTKHAFAVVLAPLANTPLMTTEAVTSITVVGGTGNGTVTSANGSTVTDRGICWATTANPTKANSWASAGSGGLGAFTAAISGLLGNTFYYVRAYGTSANGTGYSTTDVTFTSSASVTTQAVTSIGNTTATGNATSQADGGVTITDRGVCWSLSANPTKADSWVSAGSGGVGAFTAAMTGMAPGQFYYVRGYTTNVTGTSYGASDVTFTTTVPASSFLNCNINVSTVTAGNYWCTLANPGIFQNCVFTGGGGHALRVTTPGTYTLTGNTFTGFGADGSTGAAILNDSAGLVTLTITNGGNSPTYKNGASASTVVNNIRTLVITGLEAGSRIAVLNANGTSTNYSDDTEIAGISSSNTSFSYDYNWTGTPIVVNIVIIHSTKGIIRYDNQSLGANGLSLVIQLQTDRQYANPV